MSFNHRTLDFQECLGLVKPDRFLHVSAGDINPSTGKAYAINPNSGNWDDNYFSKTYGGASPSGGSGGSFDDTVKRAIELQQQANKPAIDSLQASIPEQSAKFDQQRTQLEAEKQPLKDRYQSLLDQIKGNQTTAENRQTVTTNNELGKRGILSDSGLAQQEMTNALNPITQQYTGLYKDTGLAQESDLRALANQISGSYTNETDANRAITNAIAQLQSGAASSGIQLGTQQYNTNVQNQLAQQAAAAQATQQNIANQIAQAQLANQTRETDYKVNEPYSTSSGTGIDIRGQLNGGVPTAPKPTTPPKQQTPSYFKPVSTTSMGGSSFA